MKLYLSALLFGTLINAQVSNIVRHPDFYKDFAYEGTRIVQIEEVHSANNEENVFIFSKIARNAKPDKMVFQRFMKVDEIWRLDSKKEIEYDGIISSWGQRKAFADYDKDKSIDAIFIYSLSDYDFKQQSVHLIFSKNSKFYEISTSAESNYLKDIFSENFETLPQNIRKEILNYWSNLDKI